MAAEWSGPEAQAPATARTGRRTSGTRDTHLPRYQLRDGSIHCFTNYNQLCLSSLEAFALM